MKGLVRSYLINLGAIALAMHFIPALTIDNGVKGLLLGALIFMIANILVTPFLRIILLPLNLLTLGIFAWLSNVFTLYLLATYIPIIHLSSFYFSGYKINGFVIPSANLTTFETAIVASFIIGFSIHLFHWIID